MDNFKELAFETLPTTFKDIANIIGIEKAILILDEMGGSTIYIPKSDSYHRHLRNLRIKKDYKNGMSYSQISMKYNLTTVRVRSIISS